MNKTERLVRQYLRKSCDDGSSLSPDIRFVCKNGKSFAHKFALLSRLPDLGKLFCELCLNGHDQVDIILDDVTKEEVEEARDFLYMYGDAESFAKIFGMMKTKDEIIEKLTKNLSSEAKITKIENKKEIEKKVNLDSVNMPISKSTSTLLSRFGSNTIIRTKTEVNKAKELEKKPSPKKLRRRPKRISATKISNISKAETSFPNVDSAQKSEIKEPEKSEEKSNDASKDVIENVEVPNSSNVENRIDIEGDILLDETPTLVLDNEEYEYMEFIDETAVVESVGVENTFPVMTSEDDVTMTNEFPMEIKAIQFESEETGQYPMEIKQIQFDNSDKILPKKPEVKTSLKLHECNQCSYKFRLLEALKEHTKKVHSDNEKPYSCNNCGFKTKYQGVLREHQRREAGRLLKCEKDGCNFTSYDIKTLNTHKNESHTQVQSDESLPKLICTGCSFTTEDETILKSHIGTKHAGFKFKCKGCEFSSNIKKNVDSHFATIHQGIRYPCEFCEFLGLQRSDVEEHIQEYHPNEVKV